MEGRMESDGVGWRVREGLEKRGECAGAYEEVFFGRLIVEYCLQLWRNGIAFGFDVVDTKRLWVRTPSVASVLFFCMWPNLLEVFSFE